MTKCQVRTEGRTTTVVRNAPAIKKTPYGVFFKWAGVDEILTNYAYDVYELSPYLVEMKMWLEELDSAKSKY